MSSAFKKIQIKNIRSVMIETKKEIAVKCSFNTINGLLLLTIGFIGILYLVQVNTLSTKGYTIKELEKKIVETKKSQEALHMRIVEAQSLGRMAEKISALGLVKSERIDFISPAQAVAVR